MRISLCLKTRLGRLGSAFCLSSSRNSQSPNARRGFSLLEVLIATSILLGCVVVLGELAAIGRQHARDAEDLTAAQLICQTKLNEILCGASPAASVEAQPLTEAPGWVYSAEITYIDKPGLASLTVTVSEEISETEDFEQERAVRQFQLTRWIRDPNPQEYGSLPPRQGADGFPPDVFGEGFFEPDFGGGEFP